MSTPSQFVSEVLYASHNQEATTALVGDTSAFSQINIPSDESFKLHLRFSKAIFPQQLEFQDNCSGYGMKDSRIQGCALVKIATSSRILWEGYFCGWHGDSSSYGVVSLLNKKKTRTTAGGGGGGLSGKMLLTQTPMPRTDEIRLTFRRRKGNVSERTYYFALTRIKLVGDEVAGHGLGQSQLEDDSVVEFNQNGVEFLVREIEMCHDVQIRIQTFEGGGDPAHTLRTFRCFWSFLEAGGAKNVRSSILKAQQQQAQSQALSQSDSESGELLESDHHSEQNLIRIRVGGRPQYLLTEEQFLGVVVGSVSVVDLASESVEIVLDLCETLKALGMNELLWYVCEKIAEGQNHPETAFRLFRLAFQHYEEQLEDDEDIAFASVVTRAAFEGLRRNTDYFWPEDRKAPPDVRKMRVWLRRAILSDELRHGVPVRVRSHLDLRIKEDQVCIPPVGLLLMRMKELYFSWTVHPNVHLRSSFDEFGVVDSHIEVLLMSFGYFHLMLGFDGKERALYMREKVIVLEDLPVSAIRLLAEFGYSGEFHKWEGVSLLDGLFLLAHAEKTSHTSLRVSCVAQLSAMDSKGVGFLEELQGAREVFLQCQSKPELLEAWAAQGLYTSEFLMNRLEQAGQEDVSRDVVAQVESLSSDVARLKETVSAQRSQLNVQRDQLREQASEIERLKEQVRTVMETLKVDE